ncbi:MAG: SGNH/GDSL hydrolase family protein [Deltaproteobacteria bacterium]|nr:SGNH/GDSL hydrolase family protein [Deltaproteobacteria bacterium]MBI4796364.1 SGNH/GDSL hydrolase family protein [Deltaproteobacteria bacterium]
MKKPLRLVLSVLKWAVITLAAVEVMSFLVLTLGNLFIYGSVWEGSRVNYDAYTLFQEGPRPTANNPPAPEADKQHRAIWMFGGSTMRGSTNDDAKTIPSFLAAILNREGKPRSFTVSNFGENSFNSLLETKYLQKLLIESPTRPHLIIFMDGANECVYFSQNRTAYAHHGYQRLQALIESHRRSFFGLFKTINAAVYASFTREIYDKLRQTVIPIRADSEELRNFVEMTVQRYDYVNQQAGFYGARFLLFWQPILWVETCEVAPRVREIEKDYAINKVRFAAVRQNFQVTYQALAERLRDKPYYIDFQNILCSRTAPLYKPDGVHLQDAGRMMVARQMSQTLKDRWLAGGGARD